MILNTIGGNTIVAVESSTHFPRQFTSCFLAVIELYDYGQLSGYYCTQPFLLGICGRCKRSDASFFYSISLFARLSLFIMFMALKFVDLTVVLLGLKPIDESARSEFKSLDGSKVRSPLAAFVFRKVFILKRTM